MSKISILGAGAWGTVVANLLTENGHDVKVYARRKEQVEKLNKGHMHDNLPGIILSDKILFTDDIDKALESSDVIIFAIPSTAFRENVAKAIPYINENTYLVTLTKGMEDNTLFTMSEIIEDELKKNGINNDKIVALSGPTLAEDVGKKYPSTIVSASTNIKAAEFIQDIFMNAYFRVYTNDDIKGVEVCASFKNVIALASGILTGLSYGDNIKAALLVRGLHEMIDLGEKFGLKKETFYGLAGIGDMIVTASSIRSRNFKCGKLIGEGIKPVDAIKRIGMVVEGVNFLPKAMALKERFGVELPITTGVANIIIDGISPHEILGLLMTRKKKSE